MTHLCHHPGCTKEVEPKFWGCSRHWFRLPKRLRVAIWAAYRPGQEVDKQPSARYIEAAQRAREWCEANPEKKRL